MFTVDLSAVAVVAVGMLVLLGLSVMIGIIESRALRQSWQRIADARRDITDRRRALEERERDQSDRERALRAREQRGITLDHPDDGPAPEPPPQSSDTD